VRPVVVGNSILYVQARGSILRELSVREEVEGLAGRDLTIFATHLFEAKTIAAIDFQQVPDSIIWCVRDDGDAARPDLHPGARRVGLAPARHRAERTGAFRGRLRRAGDERGRVYVIVKRHDQRRVVRYIEKLEKPRDHLRYRCVLRRLRPELLGRPPRASFSGLDAPESGRSSRSSRTASCCSTATRTARGADLRRAGGERRSIGAAKTNVHIGLRCAIRRSRRSTSTSRAPICATSGRRSTT
jgi:hypothetical protein